MSDGVHYGNAAISIKRVLDDSFTERGSAFKRSTFFELFVAEQILKEEDLSDEALIAGLVKEGSDNDTSGIDGFYILFNGVPIDDPIPTKQIGDEPRIEVVIVQAKESGSFKASALSRLVTTLETIFDLNVDLSEHVQSLGRNAIRKANVLRDTYQNAISKHPKLGFRIVYGSLGDASMLHVDVKRVLPQLESLVQRHFPRPNVSAKCWGAAELLEAYQRRKSYNLTLKVTDNPLAPQEECYVALVYLRDYFEFVTDSNGNLRRYLFEANVRDFQGNVTVNSEIRQSLEDPQNEADFWWLNNGVTILVTRASGHRVLSLDNVQIVNGLQTTEVVYNVLSKDKTLAGDRKILVRILKVTDDPIRNDVIKATNSQTALPRSSLLATETLHRQIEDHFKSADLFYDRRKNYYKNTGVSIDKIISIPYLAQSVSAILLRQPDQARARPSTIMESKLGPKLFDPQRLLPVYLTVALAMRQVDAFLQENGSVLGASPRTNFRFHVATMAMMNITDNALYTEGQAIKYLNEVGIDDVLLAKVTGLLVRQFNDFSVLHPKWSQDRVAKSEKFIKFLHEDEKRWKVPSRTRKYKIKF